MDIITILAVLMLSSPDAAYAEDGSLGCSLRKQTYPGSCGTGVNEIGERLDRMIRWAPGDPMCMYISIDNAFDYARKVLWAHHGDSPYGASVDCFGDLTADRVPCEIEVTDDDFNVLRTVKVTCTTLKHCGSYGTAAGRCCWR